MSLAFRQVGINSWRVIKKNGFVVARSFSSDGKSQGGKYVTKENMNQKVVTMKYDVRGPLLVRALEIEKELARGHKKPFKEVIKANLGDAQAMGQVPITFYRQVLAMLCYPKLIECSNFFPDAVDRAKQLLSVCRGQSVGAYTDSLGIEWIRKRIAESITARDGCESKLENIIITAGASEAIKNILKLINEEIDCKPPGVMVPIPQYPLYSATLAEFGMTLIGYYLKENNNWGLDLKELTRSIEEARCNCNPRAIVVINPGNPTGQVLTKENIQEIVKFAYDNRLIILADEVYQMNVYSEGSKFYSFKKVINELGKPYCDMELASFMSCSKGFMGECGLRAGYCEIVNFDEEVKSNLSKCISAMLCPTVIGQCLLDCVMKPPVKGDPSYDLYRNEKAYILKMLKMKAKMIHEHLNKIEGISCNEVQGAMYAFPRVHIPEKAVKEASSKNITPDALYAFELLENTGICVIPGSGFQQEPGTYHFRTTILPQPDVLKTMLETFKVFQEQFLKKYS